MNAIVRSNSKSLANPSGTARGVIAGLEEGTLASKLYTGGKAIATEGIVGSITGVPGLSVAARVATASKGRPQASRVAAADELLNSQTFQDAIKVTLEQGPAQGNRIIQNSPSFKKWVTTLEEGEAARLARVGFIGWLTSNNEEQ